MGTISSTDVPPLSEEEQYMQMRKGSVEASMQHHRQRSTSGGGNYFMSLGNTGGAPGWVVDPRASMYSGDFNMDFRGLTAVPLTASLVAPNYGPITTGAI